MDPQTTNPTLGRNSVIPRPPTTNPFPLSYNQSFLQTKRKTISFHTMENHDNFLHGLRRTMALSSLSSDCPFCYTTLGEVPPEVRNAYLYGRSDVGPDTVTCVRWAFRIIAHLLEECQEIPTCWREAAYYIVFVNENGHLERIRLW